MAENDYKQLKLKKQTLGQKILQKKKAVKTYKDIVEDPDTSKEDRVKFLALYEDAKDSLKQLTVEFENIDTQSTKVDEEGTLTQFQDEYTKLKNELDLQLNPESATAKSIESKIDDLVKKYRSVASKIKGVQISETAARGKLSNNTPTFGTPQEGGQTPTVTPQEPIKKVESKPAVSGNKGAGITQSSNKQKGIPTTPAFAGMTPLKPGEKGFVGPTALPPVDKEAAVADIAEKYGLSEALFKNIPSLKLIFEDYVNPDKKMTDEEFVRRLRGDVWYKQNSKAIKERFVQYYNYRDLQESGQAEGTTQYEQDIEGIVRSLEKRAVTIGSGAASDPIALRKAAENIYLTNKEDDTTFIDDFLASSIRAVAGTIGGKTTEGYSGAALQNYYALVNAARDNGFQVAEIIPGGSNVDQVLQGIASGKIDVNRVVADARKLASQGQPQYVRDLLAQGYNLKQVFQPYRQTMANVLEIGDPDQIDLNDPLLRSAITDKGDMNVYDFKKALKSDNRWQYTEQAKNDVSTAALSVLRDFGFQG
jgi:hypothetical protein